jgi:hypothetical protein
MRPSQLLAVSSLFSGGMNVAPANQDDASNQHLLSREHLPRLKDLDGFDTRFLTPAAGFALGQRKALLPLSVAEGCDALGPELARQVRGEVDYNAVRVDVAQAAALCTLPVTSVASAWIGASRAARQNPCSRKKPVLFQVGPHWHSRASIANN